MINRLEIASKILQWDVEIATKTKVCNEFAIPEIEFDRMSDEEFFNTMFEYSHNYSAMVAS